MRQTTFAASGFEIARKQTKRERFLLEMEAVVPLAVLCALIELTFPRIGGHP
jgi:hypothetical protein